MKKLAEQLGYSWDETTPNGRYWISYLICKHQYLTESEVMEIKQLIRKEYALIPNPL